MMQTEVAGNATQAHAVHIQLDGLLTHFIGVHPRFRIWRVLDLAEHTAVALTATGRFTCPVLAFGSLTIGTCDHTLL